MTRFSRSRWILTQYWPSIPCDAARRAGTLGIVGFERLAERRGAAVDDWRAVGPGDDLDVAYRFVRRAASVSLFTTRHST
jgi:hypothetical protein